MLYATTSCNVRDKHYEKDLIILNFLSEVSNLTNHSCERKDGEREHSKKNLYTLPTFRSYEAHAPSHAFHNAKSAFNTGYK